MDYRTKLMRFYHGVMLKDICDALGVEPTPDNLWTIRETIKKELGIQTMKDVDIGALIDALALVFVVEHGCILRLPGEPEGIEGMTLKEYLDLKKNQ